MSTVPQVSPGSLEQGWEVLAAALELAGSGVRVFPVWGVRPVRVPVPGDPGRVTEELRCGCGQAACANPGKHPVGQLVPNGHNGAVTDGDLVRRWFRVPEAETPGGGGPAWVPFNLGVATGRGLAVIDAESRSSRPDLPTGLEVLDDWETWTQGTSLPDTRAIETGSGGRHLWLRYDPAVRVSSRNRVLPGVDVKADGGYVLAPPSRHIAGARYRVLRDLEEANVPPGLLAWLLTAKGGRYVTRRAADAGGGSAPDDYDFAAIVGGTGCPAGHRDWFINDLCFRLRRSGTSIEDAARALRREWLRMEQPPGHEFPWESCLYKLRRVWDEVRPQDVVEIPAWRPPAGSSLASLTASARREPAGEPGGLADPLEVSRRALDDAVPDERESAGPAAAVVSDLLHRPDLTFNLTDTGNGIRFAQRMRDVVRYCVGEGRWYLWDGNRWCLDSLGRAQLLTEEVIKDLYVEAVRAGERREQVAGWAKTSEALARRQAMLQTAAVQPGIAIEADQLDRDPWLLVVRNGTLDLRTGTLRESLPEDLCTRRAEVDFDPGAEAPLWDKHVEFVTGGDPTLAAWLQRAVGYSLTGLTDEQALFFLWGNGANGKSTFVEVVASVLGSYATQADENFLAGGREHPTQLANLRGARLVVADETENRRMAEKRVKALTGTKRIKARYMRQDYFEFTPRFKLWITGNHKPEIVGSDDGIWRRIRLVPFEQTLTADRKIMGYDETLREELPGILNWALEGLRAWRELGGLGVTEVVARATGEYRSEEDVIGRWLEERVEVLDPAGDGADAFVENSRLYDSYRMWALANGVEKPLSAIGLGRELAPRLKRKSGTRSASGSKIRGWLGLRLRGVPQEA